MLWSAVFSARGMGAAAVLTGVGLGALGGVAGDERTIHGKVEKMGAGTMQSFLTTDRNGSPLALGVKMSAGTLDDLPLAPNTLSRCFDLDGNGRYTLHECIGDEERILDVPAAPSAGLPFQWISVNWNPAGHHNTPYSQAHFDFHFHTGDRARVEAIPPGRCGELVDCGQFKRATRPIPTRYLPSGYIDVGAVVPRMGNHLLDSESPELKDSLPFTTTFIYGAYEGELIFWEPMITLDFLKKTADACLDIRQPQGFQRAGYYPTRYCVRQDQRGQRTVSLEGFRASQTL